MDAVSLRIMGLSLEQYADMLLGEYRNSEVEASTVFPQSFDSRVVDHWLARYPDYASNAVYLDGRGRNPLFLPSRRDMDKLFKLLAQFSHGFNLDDIFKNQDGAVQVGEKARA